ncbi:MAG: GNAT family protein [Nitratireductor sp.]
MLPELISGVGIDLRVPVIDDFAEWRDLREMSVSFLAPLEPKWPPDDLSPAGFRRRIKRMRLERENGSAYSYFLVRKRSGSEQGEILGGISAFNIRHGAARSASLGYWMGEPHAGNGHMGEAVRILLPRLFALLKLERIEAACIAGNERSMRLLRSAGFQYEGTVRSYLEINGERRDHELFSLLQSDWQAIKE